MRITEEARDSAWSNHSAAWSSRNASSQLFSLIRKLRRLSWLQSSLHLAAWSPILWLAVRYFAGQLSVNPIQDLTQSTGKTALVFLVLSLSCTPLNTLLGLRWALRVRRTLGLYAFLYATIHFSIYVWLDYGFDLPLILQELSQKPYVIVGFTTGCILLVLAGTSFRFWQKRLGKNWKRLHRLVYLAGVLVILHYAWAKKGDLFRLQGEVWQPLAFGLLVLVLLTMRLPAVRNSLVALRHRLKRAWLDRCKS